MEVRRIGFLGLGSMGAGMVRRLLEAGFEVVVHNRTAAKAEPLAQLGAELASGAEGASRYADILMVSLASDDVVEEVLFGAGGPLETAEPDTVVANMSTVSPEAARDFAERIRKAGLRPLDACVLGNPRHAASGELRFMIGGAADDVERVRPVLEMLGKEIVHLGESGMGATAKVALNLVMGVQMQVLSEAVVLGERAGLPRDELIRMITGGGYGSPVMRFKGDAMLRREFDPADFRLALMRKDLLLALEQARRLGVPLPATTASLDVLTSAVESGLGEYDCAAVLAEVERMAGSPGEA